MQPDRPRRPSPTTSCPDCGAPVRPDRERLCPRCGYPLMFLQTAPETEGVVITRAPGEQDEATSVLPPSGRQARPDPGATIESWPTPALGEMTCRRCGHPNPPTRVRCERCGEELRTAVPATPPLPPPAAPSRGPNRALIIAAVLAAVAIVAVAAFLFARNRDGGEDTTDPQSPPAGLVRVPTEDVRAQASSSLSGAQYQASNTLDQNPATAWQSDGAKQPGNRGVTLQYRFSGPVPVARVTIRNGDGRPGFYQRNQRAKRLAVRTESGSTPWALRDTADPQSLDLGGQPTSSVTLVVEEVYPGTEFPDLAIAEVTFDERR